MDYKKLVESLEKMLPPKIPYGELVGAPWPYTGQGEMVYEEPESYFIEQAITAITDLLARVEAAESRAERAERERDATVQFLTSIIRYGTNPCECCKADCIDAGSDDAEYVSQCGAFEWSNPQNDMYVFGEGEE